MASEREPEIGKVTCTECDTVNQFEIGKYASGVKTIFCKECGKEIQLIYERTPDGLEMKISGEKGPM